MNKPSFTCVGASVWTPDERTGGWASDRRHPAGEMQAGIRGRQHEQHQVKRYSRYQDCMYTDNLVDCSALGFIRHTLAGSCMSVCVPPPMTNTTSSHSIAYIPRMNWSPYISWVMLHCCMPCSRVHLSARQPIGGVAGTVTQVVLRDINGTEIAAAPTCVTHNISTYNMTYKRSSPQLRWSSDMLQWQTVLLVLRNICTNKYGCGFVSRADLVVEHHHNRQINIKSSRFTLMS